MSLTKQDIANTLVKKTELTQTQALALTNQFFDQIIEILSQARKLSYLVLEILLFVKNHPDQEGTLRLAKRS